MAIWATGAVWIVDAVGRMRAAVPTIRIGDAVRIVRIRVEVSSILALVVVELGTVCAVSVWVIESSIWLRRSGRHIGICSEIAEILSVSRRKAAK